MKQAALLLLAILSGYLRNRRGKPLGQICLEWMRVFPSPPVPRHSGTPTLVTRGKPLSGLGWHAGPPMARRRRWRSRYRIATSRHYRQPRMAGASLASASVAEARGPASRGAGLGRGTGTGRERASGVHSASTLSGMKEGKRARWAS